MADAPGQPWADLELTHDGIAFHQNYKAGYGAAFAGKPYDAALDSYTGYTSGWEHGNCDQRGGGGIKPNK